MSWLLHLCTTVFTSTGLVLFKLDCSWLTLQLHSYLHVKVVSIETCFWPLILFAICLPLNRSNLQVCIAILMFPSTHLPLTVRSTTSSAQEKLEHIAVSNDKVRHWYHIFQQTSLFLEYPLSHWPVSTFISKQNN